MYVAYWATTRLNSNMISERRDIRDIGDTPIRYAHARLAEVWSLIPGHPYMTHGGSTLVYYSSVL